MGRARQQAPGGIISLSIEKLTRNAKSPPYQPQAVTGSFMCTLAVPGCQRENKIHSVSPRLLKGAKSSPWKPQAIRERVKKMHSDSPESQRDTLHCDCDRRVKANLSFKNIIVERSKIQVTKIQNRMSASDLQFLSKYSLIPFIIRLKFVI